MQLEEYFEFVEPNYTRIRGHRMSIESIIEKYLAGQSPEDIARYYDTLRLVDIYATITYHLQNKDTIDAYLQRTRKLQVEDMARSDANPSPAVLRLRQLQAEHERAHA